MVCFSYNNLVAETCKMIAEECVPLHWSRTRNELFDVHTICVLFVLFQLEQKDYRHFSSWLAVSTALGLKLKRVPHWTSLQKAFARLPPSLLRKLVQLSGKCSDRTVSLDPTYYQLTNPSKGYCKRIGRDPRKDKLLKASVVVSTKSKFVQDVYTCAKERHGMRDVPHLVKSGCFSKKLVLADKEFDAESFHQQVEDAGGRSIVPLRNHGKVPYHRIRGTHRKQLSRKPLSPVFGQRSSSEGNNSALKRRFSPVAQGKCFWQRARNVYGKYLAYNLVQRCRAYLMYWLKLSTEPVGF